MTQLSDAEEAAYTRGYDAGFLHGRTYTENKARQDLAALRETHERTLARLRSDLKKVEELLLSEFGR